ncbi:hypothetical protein PIB30_029464 [Stylosanthes scabra]|uniref:Replication protein A 70 kDa DNA-binding subunit B/D first OB fold domain-containing protein n=1 Tax=Stylosanthes scabra TaxID=79078 RepID=A0ABU6Z939_9FABA|nr:hypothetical protein [Stylosanthes scabra]
MDQVSDVCDSDPENVWILKVRVLRLWKLPSFADNRFKPSMEIVLVDQQGSRINAMVRSFHFKMFDLLIQEGKGYADLLEEHIYKFPSTEYVVVLQFAKTKL